MKLRVELIGENEEEEIVLRVKTADERVSALQKLLMKTADPPELVFYKGATEYYLPIGEVLFFETGDRDVYAHTANDLYTVKAKLYELEERLPPSFIRASKSAIVNVDRLYAVEKRLPSASLLHFAGSVKTMYASRSFYKALMRRFRERRGLS